MSLEERSQLIQEMDSSLESIRPHLAMDGGNVEVVDVSDDMEVKIKWLGNCEGCNMSTMTLRAGIEATLKAKFPTINKVVAVNGI